MQWIFWGLLGTGETVIEADWEFLLSLGKATGKFFSGGGKHQVFSLFFSVMFVCSVYSRMFVSLAKGGFFQILSFRISFRLSLKRKWSV